MVELKELRIKVLANLDALAYRQLRSQLALKRKSFSQWLREKINEELERST